MDNLCHTLVGAALGEAGLKKRTALAMPALLIGANLPDVDVLAYFWGAETALGFRRGWTHGIPALGVWPFVLTGLLLTWDRVVRQPRRPEAAPARPRELLLVSALAILTHPGLDWLNTYGMRWFMPFDGTWFYGDALFIADPWIWLALSAGVFWSRGRRRWRRLQPERPARWSLTAVSVYVLLMWGSQLAARWVAAQELIAAQPQRPLVRMMAGPLPANPLRRQVVADTGDGYALGTVDWLAAPAFRPGSRPWVAKGDTLPGVAEAAATRDGRIFLDWARFPLFQVEEKPGTRVVQMIDARYTLNPGTGFGRLTVELPL
jgi:inner membrane protein